MLAEFDSNAFYKKALELFEYEAARGMTYWQYLLAHAYEQGYFGLEKSPERSRYWLNYEPKVHIAKYECWVGNFYRDGIFPKNPELQEHYLSQCVIDPESGN